MISLIPTPAHLEKRRRKEIEKKYTADFKVIEFNKEFKE
jgi:hypothetical protein